jgi:hypothetical protein
VLGTVTISIDVELAWGNWDDHSADLLDRIEALERPIVRRLLEQFDRHDVPATWAMVAALADRASAEDMPGTVRHWYAPEFFEWVQQARTTHEIGSHGGRHLYHDGISDEEARADLFFARDVHSRNGLPFTSFVYPRNKLGRTDLLAEAGIKVYRGVDWAWHERVRRVSPQLGRITNLADKIMPLTPEVVGPRRDGALVDIAGSMLFIGRNGLRRLVTPSALLAKLKRGLDEAERQGRTFHLWFHPSNFYFRADEQFETFDRFLAEVDRRRSAGTLTVRRMGDFA